MIEKAKSMIRIIDDVAPDRLVVKVPGTHGGFINKNGYFYTETGMQVGFPTWVTPYNKPVLIGHNDMGDPVGRVVRSKFVKDLPIDYSIQFGRDTNIPTAHIDLQLEIIEPETIKKILNGTYLTVSQGCDCNDVKCSICDQNIAKEGPCEHSRNKVYDGKTAYWIFGALSYQELSIVNVPSDEYAIMEPNKIIDSRKGEILLCQPPPLDMRYGLEFVSITDSKGAKVGVCKECGFEDWTEDDVKMAETIWAEVDAFISDGMDEEDKTLTAQQRKNMPAGSFCGPGRSFPVPDCSHYSVAKSFLGRYKGPGDKGKIAACIERKGKALGCGKNKKDSVTVEEIQAQKAELETKIAELNTTLATLTQQLEQSNADLATQKTTNEQQVAASTEVLSQLDAKLKQELCNRIVDIRSLRGEYTFEDVQKGYDETVKDLSARTIESLRDTIEDLRSQIFKKKLEPLTDPTKTIDNTTIEEPKKFADEKEALHYQIFGELPKKN